MRSADLCVIKGVLPPCLECWKVLHKGVQRVIRARGAGGLLRSTCPNHPGSPGTPGPVCSFQRANSHRLLRSTLKNRGYALAALIFGQYLQEIFSAPPCEGHSLAKLSHLEHMSPGSVFHNEVLSSLQSGSVRWHSCEKLSWKVSLSIQSQSGSIVIIPYFILLLFPLKRAPGPHLTHTHTRFGLR